MKKKIIGVVSLIAVLALSLTLLVACNPYKMDSIGGGSPSSPTLSNGGYFVQQGGYVYFINGYSGADDDNTWGTPYKQSIMRAEIKNGVIDNDTAVRLVPKSIYNKSVKGGIAVFGEWVYYATQNFEKDKTGAASTTDTDFMRTKIDGSVTQRVGTISSREAEYWFTPTRVIYYLNSEINYIDFSGMKTDKNLDNAKGASTGNLAKNVTSAAWAYDTSYLRGQGTEVSDYIFYTETVTGDDSYKNYNNLCCVKYDGTDRRTLATETTYLSEGETAVDNPLKVFKFKLLNCYIEDDNTISLYYTKTHTVNSTAEDDGLFVNKFSVSDGFASVKGEGKIEKQLSSTTGIATLYPLGYADGALAVAGSQYRWFDGVHDFVTVTSTSQTVWYVYGDYAYFTASSSATALYRIKYKEKDTIETVIDAGIKADWLNLEFFGSEFYYFDSNDYNYIHHINITTFVNAEDAETTLLGKRNDADQKAYDKAQEEKEKENSDK